MTAPPAAQIASGKRQGRRITRAVAVAASAQTMVGECNAASLRRCCVQTAYDAKRSRKATGEVQALLF
jgi:hypothetical protein